MSVERPYESVDSQNFRRIALFCFIAILGAMLVSGGVAAHDDGNGLTVHNQTEPLDEHSEVHTLHIDKATADTDFYVDLHTDNGTINTTRTFEADTVKENFDVTLDPTLKSDTEVTVATHNANGTELAAETVSVDVVEAPAISFSDQTHGLDEHDEVHTLDVEMATANEEYYVDIHTANGTINTTKTFEAGTAQTDLTVTLDPTLKSTTEVTAAVHATNGTELAAKTATVTTADIEFSNQTHDVDQHGEVHTINVTKASAGTSYYVDVHTADGTINTTRTFDAETTQRNLTLEIEPTITSDTEVTAAVHSSDGTEIAAESATVALSSDSEEMNESEEMSDSEGTTGSSTPGFGLLSAVVVLVGSVLVARYRL